MTDSKGQFILDDNVVFYVGLRRDHKNSVHQDVSKKEHSKTDGRSNRSTTVVEGKRKRSDSGSSSVAKTTSAPNGVSGTGKKKLEKRQSTRVGNFNSGAGTCKLWPNSCRWMKFYCNRPENLESVVKAEITEEQKYRSEGLLIEVRINDKKFILSLLQKITFC